MGKFQELHRQHVSGIEARGGIVVPKIGRLGSDDGICPSESGCVGYGPLSPVLKQAMADQAAGKALSGHRRAATPPPRLSGHDDSDDEGGGGATLAEVAPEVPSLLILGGGDMDLTDSLLSLPGQTFAKLSVTLVEPSSASAVMSSALRGGRETGAPRWGGGSGSFQKLKASSPSNINRPGGDRSLDGSYGRASSFSGLISALAAASGGGSGCGRGCSPRGSNKAIDTTASIRRPSASFTAAQVLPGSLLGWGDAASMPSTMARQRSGSLDGSILMQMRNGAVKEHQLEGRRTTVAGTGGREGTRASGGVGSASPLSPVPLAGTSRFAVESYRRL